MLKYIHITLFLLTLLLQFSEAKDKVLLFTKTERFRHASIGAGADAIKKLAEQNNFEVVQSEDSSIMNNGDLQFFSGIIFLSTTGDILNETQQHAFETFIRKGGGFVGIHAATDTEMRNWPWFTKFIGAKFAGHPKTQNAIQRKTGVSHPTVNFLEKDEWKRFDEWYNFTDFSQSIHPVLNLDETTYEGGTNGKHHPSAWFHENNGGRMFYTAGGHTDESFSEVNFLRHISEGIKWACLGNQLDYSQELPSDDYFETTTIVPSLNDPLQIAITPNEGIFILERKGAIKFFDPEIKIAVKIHQLSAYTVRDAGGLGIALDPDFKENKFVYIYYSAKEKGCNRLSRFKFEDNKLKNEKTIIEVTIDRPGGSHQGGGLAFGNDRMLYLSTGDDTNHNQSEGYAPIDERAPRTREDAQRSAGNTNDLRGGILRIIVNKDASYSIPKGNLFAVGTPKTRPELYIKGCRNPYRIFLDKKSGFLHWGEVGPDASKDGPQGSRGHDEYNIATKAGFYGWPYHVGSEYYNDVDFETKKVGKSFSLGITNDSPRNTGLRNLPPANSATVSYPYAESKAFPILGTGSRNAMAGPVIYQENLAHNFPSYFNGKPMLYDWARARIFMLNLDKHGSCKKIDPFLNTISFKHPMDIKIGNKGDLYILDYGSAWYDNTDGSILKVRYGGKNRRPIAKINADNTVGAVPLKVGFSSKGSIDKDGDSISYHWEFGNGTSSSEANPTFTYKNPGIYTATLTVKDDKEKEKSTSMRIIAGNARPTLSLKLKDESGYFNWDNEIEYEVSGNDLEDGSLKTADIEVIAEYRPDGKVPTSKINTAGNINSDPRLEGMNPLLPGVTLIEKNNCLTCHQSKAKSIGPSYMEVALQYEDTPENRTLLLNKIKDGGSGSYGHIPMPSQAHIPDGHIKEIITSILDMTGESKLVTRSKTGKVKTIALPIGQQKGIYVISANYTDKGANGLPALSIESETISLNAPIHISKGSGKVDGFLASIHGKGAKNIRNHHIGDYTDQETTLSWQIVVTDPGTYKVSLNQVVKDNHAGSEFELQINNQVLKGVIKGSKAWHLYIDLELGEVNLPKGTYALRFVPTKKRKHFIGNIKHIEFIKTGKL